MDRRIDQGVKILEKRRECVVAFALSYIYCIYNLLNIDLLYIIYTNICSHFVFVFFWVSLPLILGEFHKNTNNKI